MTVQLTDDEAEQVSNILESVVSAAPSPKAEHWVDELKARQEHPVDRRVLSIDNATDDALGFLLCRKPGHPAGSVLHLHVVDPGDTDAVHGDEIHRLDKNEMASFMRQHVIDVNQ